MSAKSRRGFIKKGLIVSAGLSIVALGVGATLGYSYGRLHPAPQLIISPTISPIVVTTSAPTPEPTPSCATHAELTHDNLFIRFNEQRIANHLPEVANNHVLDDYAGLRAQELSTNGSLEAQNPHQTKYGDLYTWGKSVGRTHETSLFFSYSEDIAGNQPDTCVTLDGFMASPTHRSSILDPKDKYLGVGTLDGNVVFEIGMTK